MEIEDAKRRRQVEDTSVEKTKGAVAEKIERPLPKKAILDVATLEKCFVRKSRLQVTFFIGLGPLFHQAVTYVSRL